ncbi:transcriptional regulator BetI [Nitratireductor rhodophyticola]|uniref:HTH-type transcriptional regulator BetI n=1 Tax=Nitratireductor rhodophyticola TaxID=2854036 RepID=A0ABS7RCI0_9HYPH|nr:transcriptional regulator BetI [Nitratireductor rhodophyticola]MBY8918115.1 transcriptional regulator BetI [Nitratireductor rhodophyticola]MBY8921076.1 transcriptional regulator BetI [Nitratireductor rhodophyticola]WPZ14188.1 transcriptional regulator BetI [Nitratireductor rhodophyticola]
MPKIGMEPIRRRALIDAAISAIGERGALNVTMSDIAGRAGVSTALAHHYFGGKDDLLFATMRHILAKLGDEIRPAMAGLAGADRVRAIIAVNLSPDQFRPEIIAAWLAFYVEARRDAALGRLFRIYVHRLHSDLMSGLTDLPRTSAIRTARGIAALIDGLYLRRALGEGVEDSAAAIALVEDYLDMALAPHPSHGNQPHA